MKLLFRQSIEAWLILAKLTVPAMIVVRLLGWFGLVGYISMPFEPLMGLMGLPKEMSLVWVTAMLTNNYTGIVVYLDLLPVMGTPTVAQATTIASIILIAHNLPVESGVCRGAGVSPMRMTCLRIAAAIAYGAIFHRLAGALDVFQGPASLIADIRFDPLPPWGQWVLGCVQSLIAMWVIVTALLLLMAGLRRLGLIKILTAVLGPLLKVSGIGPKAAMITIIGMLLGLAYGGGLIIAESRSGRIPPEDVFGSVTLMALCHSLLEDTILLAALGGSLWGLLAGRLVFAAILTAAIVRAARNPSFRPWVVGRKYGWGAAGDGGS